MYIIDIFSTTLAYDYRYFPDIIICDLYIHTRSIL